MPFSFSGTLAGCALLSLLSLSPDAALGQSQGTAPPASRPSGTEAGLVPPGISGVIFGNHQYLLGGPRKDFNQFVLDRAYLTIRGTPAPRLSYRLTSDVFQSGDNNGWTVRMKYAYLDYALSAGGTWAANLRAGMLQTVAIEHQESFWPRWLGSVPLDRHGYFQSADVGAAAGIRLPRGLGELYAHVVNGPGYTRREVDKYKDFGLRLSIAPFASSEPALLRGVVLTAWVYDGTTAGALTTNPVTQAGDAMARDRWGVHAGLKARRLTVAVEHARRTDESEVEADTATGAVTVTRNEGSLTSAFAIVRPFGSASGAGASRFGFIGRYDHVGPSNVADRDYHYLLSGAIYDVNNRLALSLNYQEQLGNRLNAPFRAVFTNFAVTF